MRQSKTSFESMARFARREVPPTFDVSHQVIHRLEALADETIDRPLAWLTLGSMAAAVAAGSFAFSVYSTMADPMGLLVQVTPLLGH